MANLLSICQHAAKKCQIEVPASLIGSTNETAKLLLTCAQDEGEELARRPDTAWKALIREETIDIGLSGTTTDVNGVIMSHAGRDFTALSVTVGDIIKNTTNDTSSTVNTVNDGSLVTDAAIFLTTTDPYIVYRQAHSLPDDFKYVVDGTFWDRSNYWKMRGPLSQVDWQTYKSSILGDTATTRVRYQFRSDMASTDPKVMLYIDPKPTSDDDLVYEYVSTGWCKDAVDGSVNSEFEKDTDIPLLDEYLMRLGIIWRVLSRLGLPYEEELNTYDVQVENAIGRDGGGKVLDLSARPHQSLISSCSVPDTGFGQ